MSLFWRVFLLNAAMLTAAVLALLLGPLTVSTPAQGHEVLVLLSGLTVVIAANAVMLRVGLAPLQRLHRAMRTIDLLRPGPRTVPSGHAGIADLIRTFNTMLDRLEAERATSNARALSAQEAERRRIAQELHDEIGQTLTAVLLELKRVADHAPEPVSAELHQVQETTRDSLDEIRRIARRLRPGVLEELGLTSAIKALISEISGYARLTVNRKLDPVLPDLDSDTELVLYRVAQESLTNTARHARASHVEIAISRIPDGVRLCVGDDGRGLRHAPEGAGIRGMRERALLVGGTLNIGPKRGGGTEVSLTVPVRGESG